MFGMHFAPTVCKKMLQDWIDLKSNLIHTEEKIDKVDRLNYWSSVFACTEG